MMNGTQEVNPTDLLIPSDETIEQVLNPAAHKSITDLILQQAVNAGMVSDVKPGTPINGTPYQDLIAAAYDPDDDGAPEDIDHEELISPMHFATAPVVVDATPNQDATDLVKNVLFLSVRRGAIGNTRKVKEEILTTEADKSLLRVSKTLLESKELDAIRKHDYELRKWLGNTCLPFDTGVLLLPRGFQAAAKLKFQTHKAEREVLVDAFIAVYPTVKAEAKEKLGVLYQEEDYIPVEEIKEKFTFNVSFFDFRTPDVIKEIDPDWYAELVKNEEANLAIATSEITGMMREMLLDMVSHLQERLTPGDDGKKKILKESAIENLREFLNNFELRNVTNDKELSLEVAKAKALLVGTSAATLRSSEEWREKLRAGMEHITKNLGTMVVDKTGRKFRA